MKGKKTTTTAAPKLYRPINEVSALLDVKPHVLRQWETQFPGLHPKKDRAGNRMYRPEEIELLTRIKHLLKGRRYTVEGARRKLAEERPAAAKGGKRTVRVTAAPTAAGAAKVAVRAASRTASKPPAKKAPAVARPAAEPAAERESERRAVIAEVREELRSLARELRAADGGDPADVLLTAVREPVSA